MASLIFMYSKTAKCSPQNLDTVEVKTEVTSAHDDDEIKENQDEHDDDDMRNAEEGVLRNNF